MILSFKPMKAEEPEGRRWDLRVSLVTEDSTGLGQKNDKNM